MALKDLLVYVDQTDDAFTRLRLAADLAVSHGACLTALFVREWTQHHWDRRKAAELGLVSADNMALLDKQTRASIESIADRLRAILVEVTSGRGVNADLLCLDGTASVLVPQYARYADLCIVGRDEPQGSASINYSFSEQLLFVTGRPVLFVPNHRKLSETLGRRIVVAWNSSRPAARSLNDALPLIERADETTIVMINPSGFIDAHEGPSGEQIVEHLKRHGAAVNAVRIEDVARDNIAHRLLAEAHSLGADLVVAGAFGHPRLWEKMLGGVTHDLLASMTLPIFMSH
jgi:nucleotide-binding universal stress UspA family protein